MKHITAVVFDLAGTAVDHGSRAPVATLQAVFAAAGLPLTVEEARADMGIAKREHIAAILSRRKGQRADDGEIDRLYEDFIPKQFSCLREYSNVIAGVPEFMQRLKSLGIRTASTTGYTRPMLEVLMEGAVPQGFAPDVALCPDDVPGGGRPAPWMCYLAAIRLKVSPLWTMVKIGDTPSDMAEGRNAGMWTIGITRTGNEIGVTAAEWDALENKSALLEQAAIRLRHAGAHYIAESTAECFDLLVEIDQRLAAGERP